MSHSVRIQIQDRLFGVFFFATLFLGWWFYLRPHLINAVLPPRPVQSLSALAPLTVSPLGVWGHQDLIRTVNKINDMVGFSVIGLGARADGVPHLTIDAKYLLLTDRRVRISEAHSRQINQALNYLSLPRPAWVEYSQDIPASQIRVLERYVVGLGGQLQAKKMDSGQTKILRVHIEGAK